MKTAKVTVLVACITCPHCDAGIKAPLDDTYDWTPDTTDDRNTVVCDDCGKRVKVPAIKFS